MARGNKMTVEAPGYEGPECREFMMTCDRHAEHGRVLADHDKELDRLRTAMDQRREASGKAHGDLYEEIKRVERSKVPNRLFYTFISVYSVLFVLGIVSVYKGMNQNAITFHDGFAQVRVMQAETKSELKAAISSAETKVSGMKDEIKDLKRDLRMRSRGDGMP
jgi:cell division protein FtsL